MIASREPAKALWQWARWRRRRELLVLLLAVLGGVKHEDVDISVY
jgi:hypothetical protein